MFAVWIHGGVRSTKARLGGCPMSGNLSETRIVPAVIRFTIFISLACALILSSACAVIIRDSKTFATVRGFGTDVSLDVWTEPQLEKLIPPYPILIGVLAVRGPFYRSSIEVQVLNDAVTRIKLNSASLHSLDKSWEVQLTPHDWQRYPVGRWIDLPRARDPDPLGRHAVFGFEPWRANRDDMAALIATVSLSVQADSEVKNVTREIMLNPKHRVFVGVTPIMK